MTTLDYLEQADEWATRDGRVIRLEEMEPSHRRNLQWWLRARAVKLWRALNWRESISMAHAHPFEMPDGVFSSFSQCEAQGQSPDPQRAKNWLESTPFMQRLAELVADDLVARC